MVLAEFPPCGACERFGTGPSWNAALHAEFVLGDLDIGESLVSLEQQECGTGVVSGCVSYRIVITGPPFWR